MEEQRWPWRMIVQGWFEDAWWQATDEERQVAYEGWIGLHRQWQQLGARLICTIDDELNLVGRPRGGGWSFYTIWEIPTPALTYELLTMLHTPLRSGHKLTSYFSLQTVVGKPIISMERDLGGPQQANEASMEGEMAPVP